MELILKKISSFFLLLIIIGPPILAYGLIAFMVVEPTMNIFRFLKMTARSD
jgi:hypothetical protein